MPCREAALAFRRGDILEVVSQDDAVWWQARLDKHNHVTRVGLIPSRLQQQERYAWHRWRVSEHCHMPIKMPYENTDNPSTIGVM